MKALEHQKDKEITMTPYSFGTTLRVSYKEAILRVKDALKAEGFGVLTEIDIQRTMREKLGVEMDPYMILGACNPSLAYHALLQEPEVGLLLPCNVIVRAEGANSRVDITDPQTLLGTVGNGTVDTLATDAKERLLRVLVALEQQA
jgi:uncharacterized protein (DUF302 family)